METAAEDEELTTSADQMETDMASADLDQITPTHLVPISSEMSTPEPSPQPTRELRPRTKVVAKAAQIFEPSDPTHMSIDDDSDTT